MNASSIDLPQPLGPISVTHSPGATVMSSAGDQRPRPAAQRHTCSRRRGRSRVRTPCAPRPRVRATRQRRQHGRGEIRGEGKARLQQCIARDQRRSAPEASVTASVVKRRDAACCRRTSVGRYWPTLTANAIGAARSAIGRSSIGSFIAEEHA